jgi:DNA-binding transcriptional MerR regulator
MPTVRRTARNAQEAALNKAPDAFRTISEVADELDLPQHVLRFWESRFPHIKPMKRGGGRRYYRPEDIDLLRGIRHLLYGDGYTIRGVQRILREQGVRTVQSVGHGKASNLLAQPPDDTHGAGDEPNGTPALRFSPPPDSRASDEANEETEDRDLEESDLNELATGESAPQNRPTVELNPAAIAPVARPEAEQVCQASAAVTTPSSKGMTAHDVDRLKRALAELEACRRLLDKANQGGR